MCLNPRLSVLLPSCQPAGSFSGKRCRVLMRSNGMCTAGQRWLRSGQPLVRELPPALLVGGARCGRC